MVLSEEKRQTLQKVIDELPNTLLLGKPGTGKGTFMNILLRETQCEYIKINGSLYTGIDNVREQIFSFARAYSPGKMKIVYINEADRLSPNAMDALKDIIESVQSITRFFFLSNDPTLKNDADGAIKSRCGYQIDLNNPPGKEIFSHCIKILLKEKVKLENKTALLELIKKCYPDIRKIIGTLQSNTIDGKIKNIVYSSSEDLFNFIFKCMKEVDIDNLRKTLKSNYIDYTELYNHIYQLVMEDPDIVKNVGDVLIDTGEYMYRNSIVAIPEINFMAYTMNLIKKGVI